MESLHENQIAVEIQNEYKKIDEKWLRLHAHSFASIVFIAVLIEGLIALSLYQSGYVDMVYERYLIKYLLVPAMINLSLLGIGEWVVRHPKLQMTTKAYTVSLLFVAVCFVFFTVHIVFDAIYAIFLAPILLTIVYGNYRLTAVTGIVSIGLKVFSEWYVVCDLDKTPPFASQESFTNFLLSTLLLFGVLGISLVVVRYEEKKNRAALEKELAHFEDRQKLLIDELTNTYNRRALRDGFQKMMDDEEEGTYIVAMLDLDHLKQLNDSRGHVMGDKLLKVLGKILRRNCIDRGIPFRYGGDEFFLIFRNRSMEDARSICLAIQDDLKNNPLNLSLEMPLTLSIGLARYKKGMKPNQLLRNADVALYEAKDVRNAIYLYDEGEGTEKNSME